MISSDKWIDRRRSTLTEQSCGGRGESRNGGKPKFKIFHLQARRILPEVRALSTHGVDNARETIEKDVDSLGLVLWDPCISGYVIRLPLSNEFRRAV